jgi:hypothetical protein
MNSGSCRSFKVSEFQGFKDQVGMNFETLKPRNFETLLLTNETLLLTNFDPRRTTRAGQISTCPVFAMQWVLGTRSAN